MVDELQRLAEAGALTGRQGDVHHLAVVVDDLASVGEVDAVAGAGGDRLTREDHLYDFNVFFKSQTQGMRYFLVTLFGELDSQPDLKNMLYEHYPVVKQGNGYVLFDLTREKQAP